MRHEDQKAYREIPEDLEHYRSTWDDIVDLIKATGSFLARHGVRLGVGLTAGALGILALMGFGWLSAYVFGGEVCPTDVDCTVGAFVGFSALLGFMTALGVLIAGFGVVCLYWLGEWMVDKVQ